MLHTVRIHLEMHWMMPDMQMIVLYAGLPCQQGDLCIWTSARHAKSAQASKQPWFEHQWYMHLNTGQLAGQYAADAHMEMSTCSHSMMSSSMYFVKGA